MKTPPESNAITQRLDVLRALYAGFAKDKAAMLCHWLVQVDEMKMIDAFVRCENSEISTQPDFFLIFSAPFRAAPEYGAALLANLTQYTGVHSEQLREAGFDFDLPIPSNTSDPFALFPLLSTLADRVQPLQRAVVFLQPSEIRDFPAWENWLDETLQKGLPPNVRLMVALPEAVCGCYQIRKKYPSKVKTLVPDLDMPNAMRQLASTGNPDDPTVAFRLLFLDIGQAAGAKDFDKLKNLGEKALALTQRQPNWEHMEFTVQAALGSHYLPYKSYWPLATEHYAKACKVADRMTQTQHPLAKSIFVQSRLFKGAGLLNTQQPEAAALAYEEAIPPLLDDPKQILQLMEAQRLAGQSHRMAGKYRAAWEHYWNALATAERLEGEQRYDTLILYIGAALLKLCSRTDNDARETSIRQKMAHLVGSDWETQMRTQKIEN